MNLKRVNITNFRSIEKSENIFFDNMTVIVGKNNEGKSNLLKALNIAFSIILDPRRAGFMIRRQLTSSSRNVEQFNWERDYPIKLQNRKPMPTIFSLEFSLNEEEVNTISKIINRKVFTSIFVDITINQNLVNLKYYTYKLKKSEIKSHKDKLHEFIVNSINFVYIPAIRTEHASISIIEEIIDSKLDLLNEDSEYLKANALIKQKQQDILNTISTELQTNLKVFLPNIKNITLSLKERLRRSNIISGLQFVIDDGIPTELAYKGDGIKSLITLALLHEKGVSRKNSIVAIEEPESHLHSGAMHELKKIIELISHTNQTIITTHNQIFVDRENISNNIVVDNGRIKTIQKISTLRKLLGIKLSENLASCEKVLLVEGYTDKIILTHILSLLNQEIKSKLKSGELLITDIGGASHAKQYYDFYTATLCDVYGIFDNDTSGNSAIEEIIKQHSSALNKLFRIDTNSRKESEIENIFKKEIIEKTLKEGIFSQFNIIEYSKSNLKWSEEIKKQWVNSGLSKFDKNIENFVKQSFTKKIITNLSLDNLNELNLKILTNLSEVLY